MEQKVVTPAMKMARKELGAYLKELRCRAGLTQATLASRMETSAPRVGFFELGKYVPTREELRAYYDIEIQVTDLDYDLFLTVQKAEGIDYEDEWEAAGHIADTLTSSMKCQPETFVYERAITDPKGLLVSARSLLLRANAKFELINSLENGIAARESSLEFCSQMANAWELEKSVNTRLGELNASQKNLAEIVKIYCTQLAEESLALLDQYKKIDEVFTLYAGDLPGYTLTRRQFYLGETLETILPDEKYTRRWAQTLQSRCLSAFQARVKENYGG
jgi:transcriptional regulator with XRE-family HTH domain